MVLRRTALSLAAALLAGAASAPAVAQQLDHQQIAAEHFGNDAPWYHDRIPFFESADPRLDAVYYYRWSIFRAHQRDLGEQGYITTEFADDVSWQREPYASLNDATGFHIAEGRWLNDRRFTDDYINFMYHGGNNRHFTDYMADSVWGRYLVDGDGMAVRRHLPVMQYNYGLWEDHYDWSKRLYYIEPLLDATEYTVSSIDASGGEDGFRGGDSFRPSINSYMVANARAISRIADMAGDQALSAQFAERADQLQQRMIADLWNPALGHFTDRYKVDNEHVDYWDFIRARELAGYLPWTFDLAPDDAKHASAWSHLLNPASLKGEAGMRTVEKPYEYYMKQYRYLGDAPECQWNGPIWPYQTTQVLTGMANLLDHYDHTGPITRSEYMRLLREYAELHYQGDLLDLEEDYHPETGKPIVGLDRSHHYFHSGFIDLILTGPVGIRPRADDMLEINPLLPDAGDAQALDWFRVEDVPYHGRRIAVAWDADGSHYGKGRGLSIEVDGQEVARRATLGRLTVPVTRAEAAPIRRDINRAVQLVRGDFPMASASSNTEAEALHDAIDGRTWFYPELPNGWDSAPSTGEQWYAVDFGKPVRVDRAELAFFDDGATFAAPSAVAIEYWQDGRWHPLARGAAVPNGITDLQWSSRDVTRLRAVMKPTGGRAIRLAEFKALTSDQAD